MADDIAISVENLHKDFKLPHERANSLKERILHFRRRKKTYEVQHALKDINLEIKKGEFFGIVGRNGSGKSTLLKLIGGIYQPTSGTIKVNGTLTPFIELGIGFNPELTGKDNVFLNGAILGLTHNEVEQKYNEIVEFAELDKFMDQKLKNYSSGMQVRLAFSISLQAHNDILLIDEVLAVGDERFQNKCTEVFNRIKKDSSKTVVFVSHDMGAVQRNCNRAIVIHDSQLIYEGDAQGAAYEYKKLNFPAEIDKQSEALAQKTRWGSKDITIEKFHAREERVDDDEHELIITLETKLHNNTIENTPMQVGLAFYTTDDEHVAGPNNLLRGKMIVAKDSLITMRVPKHYLNSGRYKITAALFNLKGTVTYDHHEREYRLAIARKTNELGPTVMGGEWMQD